MSTSTIFATTITTTTKTTPKPDAKIRVELFKAGSVEKVGYIKVDLLEFHPDFDNRLKCRSYAYVRPRPELLRSEHAHIYEKRGEGYLEEPYISINEVFIHPADRKEMMQWCLHQIADNKGYTPLIVHPQPLPFPMFNKGDRVVCIKKDERNGKVYGVPGSVAVCVEKSSIGGMTKIRYDDAQLNMGFEELGVISDCLRKVEG